MASSNKTPHFRLNQWSGSDKPKRDDFNTDNLAVDTALFTLKQQSENHKQDQATHVTQEEKDFWNAGNSNQGFSVMTYQGNGASRRTIPLGFQPEFVFISAINHGLVQGFDGQNGHWIFSAVVSKKGSTAFASLKDNGFEVLNAALCNPDGNGAKLNEVNVQYLCFYQ